MKERIAEIFADSVRINRATLDKNSDQIEETVRLLVRTLQKGGKILLFGNGGSAADSQHIAAEFIGRFRKERQALAAIALTTDSSVLTCLGNDYSFEIIFSRQIEALGRPGDVAFGISTSGDSENVILGLQKATEMQMATVALTGNGGGRMRAIADLHLDVPASETSHIQEAHMCIYHAICELVEQEFATTTDASITKLNPVQFLREEAL